MQYLYEAAIVGGGAAGLSAALVLGRSCRSAIVCDDGRPRNAVADRMHGFLSRDGMPPGDLLCVAREQLREYPAIEFVQTHVDAIVGERGSFCIETSEGATYRTRRVLLATGVYDALPDVEGLREFWGRSAFVCPYCDGWEVRDKRIAVVGRGSKAVELAQELRQWSRNVVACMEGDESLNAEHRDWLKATGTKALRSRLRRLHGSGGQVRFLEFEDGSTEPCDAIFFSAPLRPRYPLVDMLGCRVHEDGKIEIDDRGRTSVPGVYAAGDAVTNVHQVVLAASSGVCAAMAINEDRLKEEVREAVSGIS